MQRASKQESVNYKDLSDFRGGWNCRTSPFNIEDNELADVNNMTFSDEPGRIRTRKGTGTAIATYTNNITKMFPWGNDVVLLADGKYRIYDATGMHEIGTALGSGVPSFCEYDGNIYCCADSHIQKISKTGTTYTLTTLSASPADAVGLFAKEGRLCCWVSGAANTDSVKREHYIFGARVGDPDSVDSWTIPDTATDLDPVEFQIGYKVAGNIVGIAPFLQDTIIFKERCVLRFTGSMLRSDETTAIYEVARNERLSNKDSLENVGGYLYYIDALTGVRMIQGVDTYGDLLPTDIIPKVNSYIKDNINTATTRVWHLKHNKIIAFGIGDKVIPSYYEYGIDNMPSLKWSFNDVVGDIVETDDGSIFIAVGKKFYEFNGDFDDNSIIKYSLSTKAIRGNSNFLLKRTHLHLASASSITTSNYINVFCNSAKIARIIFDTGSDDVYLNTDDVFGNLTDIFSYEAHNSEMARHQLYRDNTLQIKIDNEDIVSGVAKYGIPMTLIRLGIEYAQVGVVG